MGQNLIYNGSFELNVCPTSASIPWPYGYSFNYAMTTESGWLNVTSGKITCDNICTNYKGDPNYGVILGDTAETKCCGKDCVQSGASSVKFDKNYFVQGILGYNKNSMATSSYLVQRLSSSLIEGHNYHFYMFYTYYRIIKYQGKYMVGHYETTNKLPNIKHNGFGLAFSSNQKLFDSSWSPSLNQDLLTTSPNQRKLRFFTSYAPVWRKLDGSFIADSAYNYLTLGNFWKTEEISFTPPLNQMTRSPVSIFLDSINLWDVTHKIVADSQYCKGQKTKLYAKNYSRGITTWLDKNGKTIGTGDTLKMQVLKDSLIYSMRYFPEIQYTTIDSFRLQIKNSPPVFSVNRLLDSCKLPAMLTALPSSLSYTWNGVDNGKNNFTINQSGDVQITATDSNNCVSYYTYIVQPEIKFTISLMSDTCMETAVLAMFPTDYNYFFRKKIISNPFNTELKGGLYIIAEQTNGCRDSQYFFIPLCIVEKDPIWLPNAFTPNNNDINDHFGPVSQYIKSYELIIFNRWGEKIFISDKNNPAWDGTYKNHQVPDGVYHYQLFIELKNKEMVNKSGVVNVLR